MSAMSMVVDQAAYPVSLVPMSDAVASLVSDHRVQAIASDETRRFRSRHLDVAAPLIIMNSAIDPSLVYTKLMNRDLARVSRRVLFARDRYECQYCDFVAAGGKSLQQLTVDHVKPACLFESRGAATTWENVTSACRSCNTRKGGRLPMEVGMMPRTTPKEPHYVQVRFAGRLHPMQRDYLADFFPGIWL